MDVYLEKFHQNSHLNFNYIFAPLKSSMGIVTHKFTATCTSHTSLTSHTSFIYSLIYLLYVYKLHSISYFSCPAVPFSFSHAHFSSVLSLTHVLLVFFHALPFFVGYLLFFDAQPFLHQENDF
jgi:hypothetical protein